MGLFSKQGAEGAEGSTVPQAAIDAFWAWWAEGGKAEASELFAGRGDEQRFAVFGEQLGELVKAIGDLAVATGPGRSARHLLVVTAGGDPDLREAAAAWLASAPAPDEEFEYADHRQPHPDPASLTLRFDGGELDLADTTILTEVDGPKVHVQVAHPRFAELEEEDRFQVTFLFLDAVLGERDVEGRIGEIQVVAQHALGTSPRPLLELPEILASAG